MRDYSEIVNRIDNLKLPLKIIGEVHGHPIHLLHLESSCNSTQNILITGGIHGDEPAGVQAVLHFLSRDNSSLLKRFNFLVIPCINPYGYVHETRENRDGADINRSFESDEVAEVAIVKEALGQTQFSLAVDFHEDFEATGFYIYEGKRDEQYYGPQIVDVVKEIGPIDTEESEKDSSAITDGVYKVSPEWGTEGLIPYLLHHHSHHVIITETPTVWLLKQRVELHLTVLDTVLSFY